MNKRNQAIDALRGLAASLVMVLHVGSFFSEVASVASDGQSLVRFFQQIDTGRIGITIFFVISGFVIPKSIKEAKSRPIKRFLIKRFFRLYPLFWFSLLAGLVFIWYLNDRSFNLDLILANFTMIPAFFSEPFVIGLYWTLETELIFYGLTVLLFITGLLRKLHIYLLLTGILFVVLFIFQQYPSMRPDMAHWTATPYHLSLMFLGVLYRHYFDNDKYLWNGLNPKLLFSAQLVLVVSVPILVLILHFSKIDSENVPDAIAYLSGIFIFFMGVKFWKDPPKSILYLGTISYSIYLMHPIIINILKYMATELKWFNGLHISFYIIISIVLTYFISHITYQFVENPNNQYGHRYANKLM